MPQLDHIGKEGQSIWMSIQNIRRHFGGQRSRQCEDDQHGERLHTECLWQPTKQTPKRLEFFCSFSFFFLAMWLAGSQFPNQGLNPGSLALKTQSPNHWTSMESPWVLFFICAVLPQGWLEGWGVGRSARQRME